MHVFFVEFESTAKLEIKIVSSGPCQTSAGMSTQVFYSMKYQFEAEGEMEMVSALSYQTITTAELNAQLSVIQNPQVKFYYLKAVPI